VQGESTALFLLEALEFLDEIKFELDGDPGVKLKGNILVRIGSAIAAGLGHQPDGAGPFYPSLGGQNKAVQTGLFSKPIEFDGFKTGVVELLPDTEKLDGVAVAQPVLNDVVGPLRIAVSGNVGAVSLPSNVLYRYYAKQNT
jgi:hypothetical protein